MTNNCPESGYYSDKIVVKKRQHTAAKRAPERGEIYGQEREVIRRSD
jgi:hypothetical protein